MLSLPSSPSPPAPTPTSTPTPISGSSSSSSSMRTLWRPLPVLALSGLLRAAMLLYGLHQDATSPVKYTDIDYLVFTDAARYAHTGGWGWGWGWGGGGGGGGGGGMGPYERETYRYTPLLAWLLVPTAWGGRGWFSFGKVLFAAGDLVAGYGIARLLVRTRGMPQATALKWAAAAWLLNPMVAAISTRGSSEGLLGAMVVALLAAVYARNWCAAGAWMGLCVHWKIYPVVYAVAIVWWMGGEKCASAPPVLAAAVWEVQEEKEKEEKGVGSGVGSGVGAGVGDYNNNNNNSSSSNSKLAATATATAPNNDPPQKKTIARHLRDFITYPRLAFSASALGTFAALNLAMYALYGAPFLQHTYLHHLTRLDHRHNFSPYNTLLYLVSSSSSTSSSSTWPSVPFIPQMALSAVVLPLAYAKRDLAGTMFAQTFAFVAFNKVCTSQYFMWYLVLLPLYLPSSAFARRPALGAAAAALWAAAQAAWLASAYKLEFLAAQTFVPGLWASALAFFAVNVWILGIVVQDLARV